MRPLFVHAVHAAPMCDFFSVARKYITEFTMSQKSQAPQGLLGIAGLSEILAWCEGRTRLSRNQVTSKHGKILA